MARILVIDDDAMILGYFRRFADKWPMEVVTAASSEEGCRLASDASIKAIVTDFVFDTGLSGCDLLRELRRLRPDVPLVVISGYTTQEMIDECRRFGVNDFLAKPFELSFLPMVVQRLLGTTVEQAQK